MISNATNSAIYEKQLGLFYTDNYYTPAGSRWKSEFTYDTWLNNKWYQGPAAYYLHDGKRVIEDCTTSPTVSSPRGVGQSMVASYRYDPFRNTISSSGSLAGANLYRFSSKEIHANSGMYYYGLRFYDPNLQRWINRDPIGERGGKNLYSFVRNAPIVAVDNFGLLSWGPYCFPKSCVQQAIDAQKKHSPGNDDSYGGAFRHCVAACCLQKRYGSEIANIIVDLWDMSEESGGRPDSPGDRLGEQMGLHVGEVGGSKSCAEGCLKIYPNLPLPLLPIIPWREPLPGTTIDYPHTRY